MQALLTLHANWDEWIPMATLTIRNVDPEVRKRLRVRAAQNSRSMEAELRQILKDAVGGEVETGEPNVADEIWSYFAPFNGVELEPHPPTPARPPPKFRR
jgi:plasmid stability protein